VSARRGLGPVLAAVALAGATGMAADLESALAHRLERAWAGFDRVPSDAGRVPEPVERLLSGHAEGAGVDRARELARALARRFDAWFAAEVSLPAPLVDRGAPTPEAWAGPARDRLARAEARALRDALDAPDPGAAERASRAFTRLRFRRAALMPAAALDALRRRETRDGLALWTVVRGLELAGEAELPAGAVLARALRSGVAEALAEAERAGRAPDPALTGCGIALVLDVTRPGWQDEWLARQVYLDAMLPGPLPAPTEAPAAPGRAPS